MNKIHRVVIYYFDAGFSNYTRREQKFIKPFLRISRDIFGLYLCISFEIIRRRRSTLSYAAARAHRTRIMLTMPLRLALHRRRRHIFYFLSRAAPGPIIVEKRKQTMNVRQREEWRRGDASATRKLQSQFFARQILLPHSLKRFRSAVPSITQNAFKLDTACDTVVQML